jgi:hypothetical protein
LKDMIYARFEYLQEFLGNKKKQRS